MIGRGENIEQSLSRTRRSFFGRIGELLSQADLDDSVWEELEELLIQADVGVTTTVDLVQAVRDDSNEYVENIEHGFSPSLVGYGPEDRRI